MAYKKYMFDLDFGPPPANRPKAVEQTEESWDEEMLAETPPPPTFTEEDLQVVREAAYDEGHRTGLDEASETQQALLSTAMDKISAQMAELGAVQEEANDQNQRVAARVAMAVLKKVLPAACEQYAFDEVGRTVLECFAHVLDEPRIIVRVEPGLVDRVKEYLEPAALQNGFEGRVVVQADVRMVLGDCRVEWTDGGAERDQARLLGDIEAAVERSLAPPERRPEE